MRFILIHLQLAGEFFELSDWDFWSAGGFWFVTE